MTGGIEAVRLLSRISSLADLLEAAGDVRHAGQRGADELFSGVSRGFYDVILVGAGAFARCGRGWRQHSKGLMRGGIRVGDSAWSRAGAGKTEAPS